MPSPNTVQDTNRLIVASDEVFDFVLRDRMGMDLKDLIMRVVQGEGLWIEMDLSTDNVTWFSDDDSKATVPHRVILDLKVWTSTEDKHEKTANILRRVNANPEIVLGAYHERNFQTVTSVSVAILSRNTTSSMPFVSSAPSIYGHVKRIGWIIGGTVGIFMLVVASLSLCNMCARSALMSGFPFCCCCCRKSGSNYQQFQSNSGHDLDEFHLDEEEVTVELHQI